MIANAWYPIVRQNLSFGYSDNLGFLIKHLHNNLQIPLCSSVDDIVDFLNQRINEDVVRNTLWNFTIKIAYDFLKPWINKKYSYEIKQESQEQGSEVPYSIFDDSRGSSYIIIDNNWKEYLKDNYAPLLDFTYRNLADFIKLENKRTFDLVTLLKTNNDTTTTKLVEAATVLEEQSLCYHLNTNNKSYIFNSHYDMVFSCFGNIIVLNNKYYNVMMSEESFIVREIVWMTNKQAAHSNSIINAHWNTPLFDVFAKKMDIEQIEEIRQDSVEGKHIIRVSGKWYNNKGHLVEHELNKRDIPPKRIEESTQICEEQKTEYKRDSDERSSLIGRYIRMLPSQVVGMVIRVKESSLGQRKFVVETTDGKLKEIYDNPYFYVLLPPRKVKKIPKK